MEENKHDNSEAAPEVDNHLLYEEEETKFEMVIPQFGDCGEGDVDISKIGQDEKPKQASSCSNQTSLTDSAIKKSCDSQKSSQLGPQLSKKAAKKAAHIQENLTDSDSKFQSSLNLTNLDEA